MTAGATARGSGSPFGAVVLDIEGTTTPVSFVYDTLFPYARAHLHAYLRGHADSADLRAAIELLRAESPDAAGIASDVDALAGHLESLMDGDKKSPGLKLIQGHIWERGYRDGSLRGEVFADVAPALERWHAAGVSVAIYSSGSALAQQLLFAHSTAGDLTKLIDHYFDTGVGPKQSPESYGRIAVALGRRPADVLFISDIVAELLAARASGMQTLLCARPGNAAVPPNDFDVIGTFPDND